MQWSSKRTIGGLPTLNFPQAKVAAMKIHEYQAKQILRNSGVPVPRNIVVRSAEEAAAAYDELGGSIAVVKAQIHAGGRGKGTIKSDPEQHGVQLVKSSAEAAEVAGRLLGGELVTIQTGPEGKTVSQVLVEEGCDIARELYLGIVVDRASSGPVLMVSSEGGMDIEEVAANTPEKIFKDSFHPDTGLLSYQARKLAAKLGLEGKTVRSAEKFMRAMCRTFVDCDCSLAEINPLVVTGDGEVIALDAKMGFTYVGIGVAGTRHLGPVFCGLKKVLKVSTTIAAKSL